jgi:hypothetical protein
MIRTVAELLRALQEVEIRQIEKAGIRHASTIGEMHEGLTSSILDKAIPSEAGLRVVSGFVENGSGMQSGQIDCMLVFGEGMSLPYSKHSKWHVRDVVAVLEVKKRLFSRELADAQEHLRAVLDIYGDYIVRDAVESFNIEPSLFAFGNITGVVPPTHDEASRLPFHLEMLYRTLIVEQISPLRIILGYGGYASEFSFRQAFVRFLEKGRSRNGFGAGSLPQLVICGKYSLVKTNGHPYSAPLRNDRWLIVATSNENPLGFLLELIWTRLSRRMKMPNSYLSDLSVERVSPLLWCKAVEQGPRQGWQFWFDVVDRSALEQDPPPRDWKPFVVSPGQFAVMNTLCVEGSLSLEDTRIRELRMHENTALDELCEMRLVAKEGNRIVLLTRLCRCAIMPSGELIVGEDSNGRMTAWVEREMTKARKSPHTPE